MLELWSQIIKALRWERDVNIGTNEDNGDTLKVSEISQVRVPICKVRNHDQHKKNKNNATFLVEV